MAETKPPVAKKPGGKSGGKAKEGKSDLGKSLGQHKGIIGAGLVLLLVMVYFLSRNGGTSSANQVAQGTGSTYDPNAGLSSADLGSLLSGTQGEPGQAGPAGAQGAAGKQGKQGKQGKAGKQGKPGPARKPPKRVDPGGPKRPAKKKPNNPGPGEHNHPGASRSTVMMSPGRHS